MRDTIRVMRRLSVGSSWDTVYITLNVEYNKLFLLVFHTYIRQNPTTGIVYYSPCKLLAIIKIHFIMTFYKVTQSLVKSSFFSII